MPNSSGFTILSEESLPPLSEALDRQPSASDEHQIALLQQASAGRGIAEPASRGPDVWRRILDTIRRRRVLKILPPAEVTIPLLSFHVPAGCTGRLQIASADARKAGLSIRIAGSGWGSQRNQTYSANTDYLNREHCMRLDLAVRVQVTLYEEGVPPQTDILGVAGRGVETIPACPDCAGESELAGAMAVPADSLPRLDLRKDPVGQTIEETITLIDESSISLSLPVPVQGLGASAGIEWSRQANLSCKTKYELAGGRLYRPCQFLDEAPDLPFWRVE